MYKLYRCEHPRSLGDMHRASTVGTALVELCVTGTARRRLEIYSRRHVKLAWREPLSPLTM